jgi:hypothetical protein
MGLGSQNEGVPVSKTHTGPACDFFCKWPAAKKKDLAKRTASPAA